MRNVTLARFVLGCIASSMVVYIAAFLMHAQEQVDIGCPAGATCAITSGSITQPKPFSVVIYVTGSDGYPCTMRLFQKPIIFSTDKADLTMETSCPQSPADRSIDKQ